MTDEGDNHEQRMGERHDGLLVPTPSRDASIAGGQSRVFGVGGGLRGLDEQGPQPGSALAGAPTAVPSRTLVVTRTLVMTRRQACPGSERCGRGETRHVRANFGDHHLRRRLGETRDGVKQGDDLGFSSVLGDDLGFSSVLGDDLGFSSVLGARSPESAS
jgi:hypothetical protein